MATKVAVFTDASRIELADGSYSAAHGRVAIDLHDPFDSFAVPSVTPMVEHQRSTIHAEVSAVYEAAHAYSHVDELHIFTDSLYAVSALKNPARLFDPSLRRLRVFPELLQELALMQRVHLHHVRAHKFFFFNELVDQMVKFVAKGELTPAEAEDWARKAAREGVVAVPIVKGHKPKLARITHERNSRLFAEALARP